MNNVFQRTDDELKKDMGEHWADGPKFRIYFDVLLLRRYENLVNETKALVNKTWWVSFGTWALVIATWALVLVTIFYHVPVR